MLILLKKANVSVSLANKVNKANQVNFILTRTLFITFDNEI